MAIVLGGGLSGLSAGYYMTKKPALNKLKLLILEASNRFGGWIDSTNNAGFLFEAGPRTIRPKGHPGMNTLNMIDDLGLSDKVIPILPNHPAAKNRMIFAKNKLNRLPSSLIETLQKKEPFSKPLASVLLHDLKAEAPIKLKDDTIYNFVERRFGTEIADYAISPMICGICAGDAKEISVQFMLGQLFEMEKNHGSIVKGFIKAMFQKKNADQITLSKLAERAKSEKWSIYSLSGGLELLPKTLSTSIEQKGGKIFPNHKIEEIKFYNDNKKVCVKVKENYAFCAEHLISGLPSHELGRLLAKQHPVLAEELQNIPFVNVAVVNLQYDTNNLIKEDAFGFLVPPKENLPILGVIFDSCCFPNQKGTVLTAMLGGKWFEKYFGQDPSEEFLLEVATTHIHDILKIKEKPKNFKVHILKKCIPQYIMGHHERVRRIRDYIKDQRLPLYLCGSSFDGIGVNDVILSAKNAVESIVN